MLNSFGAAGSAVVRVQRWLPQIYVAVALFVLVTMAILTPPFFVPDETAHADREIQIASGQIVPTKLADGAGGAIDANVVDVTHAMGDLQWKIIARYPIAKSRPDGRVPIALIDSLKPIRWAGHDVDASFTNTAVYPPALYLPAALGWKIGKAREMTVLHSMLLARLLAALAAVALGWLTLLLAEELRWVLFLYLLMPSALSLSASCSQDAVLFSAAGLTFVLLWRALRKQRMLTAGELAVVTILLLVCCSARSPYLPMVVVLPMVWMEARRPWRAILGPLLCAAIVVLGVVLWQESMKPFGIFHLPGANPADQIHFLKAHPLSGVLWMTAGTLRIFPKMTLKGVDLLGTNDAFPPAAIYVLLVLACIAVWWAAPRAGLRRGSSRLALGLGLLLVIAGISLAEYIFWNPARAHAVDGLQARYYLPLVPFALLLWPFGDRRQDHMDESTQRAAPSRDAVLLIAMAVFAAAVLNTPWVAAHCFYGVGMIQALHAVL